MKSSDYKHNPSPSPPSYQKLIHLPSSTHWLTDLLKLVRMIPLKLAKASCRIFKKFILYRFEYLNSYIFQLCKKKFRTRKYCPIQSFSLEFRACLTLDDLLKLEINNLQGAAVCPLFRKSAFGLELFSTGISNF